MERRMRYLARLLVVLQHVLICTALSLFIIRKPIVGGLLPPYDLIEVPAKSLWGMMGWEVDAFLCITLGLSAGLSYHFAKRIAVQDKK